MNDKMKFGIIGNGRFGKLLASIFSETEKVKIQIYDRNLSNPTSPFFLLEAVLQSDYVFPCVPINQLETLIKEIAQIGLGKTTVLVDVASVKEYPVNLYSKYLPNTSLIATHPMFGPGNFQEEKGLISQIKALEPIISISNISASEQSYKWLTSFMSEIGLKPIEISPKDHDIVSAKSQFVTLFTAFSLKRIQFSSASIGTKSNQELKKVTDMVTVDIKLLEDMYKYNRYCIQELKNFQIAIEEVSERISTQ